MNPLEETALKEHKKFKDISIQFGKWEKDSYNNAFFYLSNAFKILVGIEPSKINPNNHLVNAFFYEQNRNIKKTPLALFPSKSYQY